LRLSSFFGSPLFLSGRGRVSPRRRGGRATIPFSPPFFFFFFPFFFSARVERVLPQKESLSPLSLFGCLLARERSFLEESVTVSQSFSSFPRAILFFPLSLLDQTRAFFFSLPFCCFFPERSGLCLFFFSPFSSARFLFLFFLFFTGTRGCSGSSLVPFP